MTDQKEQQDDRQHSLRVAISSSRGKHVYNGDRVFLGSLDDSVSRWPYDDRGPSLDYLNRRLVDQVLFGAPVCVRVGNLLYQDQYLTAIKDPSSSHLVELAKVGFVQIQMKRKSINESIQARIDTNTESAIAFARKHDWKPGSALFQYLSELDGMLAGSGGKRQYGGDFNGYFRALMNASQEHVTQEFMHVLGVWQEQAASVNDLRRDRFEKIALTLFGGEKEKVRRAMWVANAANHWAYAMELAASDVGRSGPMPMVETTQFDRHAQVCAQQQPIPAEIAAEILKRQGMKDPINTALNMIRIPEAAYRPEMSSRLARIAHMQPTQGNDKDDRMRERFLAAKLSIVSCINQYLADPSAISDRDIVERAKIYQEALYDALGTRDESHFQLGCRFWLRKTITSLPEETAKAMVGAAAGGAIAGPLGFVVGVALSSVDLRLTDRVSGIFKRSRSDMETAMEVSDEVPEKTVARLSKTAKEAIAYGPYTGVRTLAADKTLKLIEEIDASASPALTVNEAG